ncbi:MAG: hypothetical protein GY751_00235 [Bacteroidetes bacterium]|nr:hypothetical protein [Bacteroidota bacterium]
MSEILELYNYVIMCLHKNEERRKVMTSDLLSLEKQLQDDTLTGFQKKGIKIRQTNIAREILAIDKIRLSKYEDEITPYIQQYRQIERKKIDFETEDLSAVDKDVQILEKELFERVSQISKKYVPITLVSVNSARMMCDCGTDLTNISNRSAGRFVCPSCYQVHHIKIKRSKIKIDSTSDNMSNFLSNFECTDISRLPLVKIGKLKDRLISNKPLDKVNHQDIYKTLSILGMSQYNGLVNLIGHVICGWKIPSIRYYRTEFMRVYGIIRQSYKKIANKNRDSNLPLTYLAYRIFKIIGCPYPKSWFKFAVDRGTLMNQKALFDIACKNCGSPDIAKAV